MVDKVKLEKNKKNKTEIIFIFYLFTILIKNIFLIFSKVLKISLYYFSKFVFAFLAERSMRMVQVHINVSWHGFEPRRTHFLKNIKIMKIYNKITSIS